MTSIIHWSCVFFFLFVEEAYEKRAEDFVVNYIRVRIRRIFARLRSSTPKTPDGVACRHKASQTVSRHCEIAVVGLRVPRLHWFRWNSGDGILAINCRAYAHQTKFHSNGITSLSLTFNDTLFTLDCDCCRCKYKPQNILTFD